MALVKMKPTSPGRRGMVKVVNTGPVQRPSIRRPDRKEIENCWP